VDLSDDERAVLRCGLLEWWGPARPTDALAAAMGFSDRTRLSTEVGRLIGALDARDALSPEDWQRVLVATEVVFASDVFGSGLDWPVTTGISDAATIALLRAVQRKMPRWRGSYQFSVEDGTVTVTDPNRPPAGGG
jgi:hypothetical protein